MAISCTINSVTRNIRDIVIEDILTQESNSASFGLDETWTNKPIEGQDVEIQLDGTSIFTGRVVSVQSTRLDGTTFAFQVECTDYTIDLDKKLVVEDYGSDTLYNIVKDIMDNYTSGLTYNNVIDSGTTLAGIKFNYLNPSQCFQRLADITGWDWYIDVDKDLHFFPEETSDAPIELDDTEEDFNDLVITPDTTQLANRIFVRGGYYLSAEYTQDTITAVAGQTEFPVRYRPYELTVKVDAVSKTVGIENEDVAGGHDFLLNADEKLLKVDTISMSGGEAIIMKYKYKIPLLERIDDYSSQTAIKAIEGGDGIYEKIIVDDTIEEVNIAQERGKAELIKYANPIVSGSFTTFNTGFKAGQRLHIDLTDRNTDEYYLIRQVTATSLGGNQIQYTIQFATFLLGFNWLLIKILDATRKTVFRDDEVLDVLRIISGESCMIDDTSVTVTTETPPYQWGPGGSPQGYWNISQWG